MSEMFSAFYINICLIFITVYLFLRWKRRKLYQLSAKLGGPTGVPLFGSVFEIAMKNSEEILQTAFDNVERYGMFFKVWIGPKLILTVGYPKDVEKVLSAQGSLEKAFFYSFFECNKGLISSPVKLWKVHRKLLNSSFNMKILKSFIPVFNEKSEILCKRLDSLVDKDPFDFYDVIANCTLDMICSTTLGTNTNYQNNYEDGEKATKAIEKYVGLVVVRLLNPLYYSDFLYKLTKDYALFKIAKEKALEVAREVIEMKKKSFGNTEAEISETDLNEYRKPQIFINQVFQLSKETDVFDDIAIRDEIDTIITAGYDTAALSMSHTILLLAMHQDIQEKVVAELKDVFYDANESPDYDVLSKLVYTEMVIKESLRVLPVVPFAVRTTTEDVHLDTDNLVVPAGVDIIIPIYHLHRDPKYWGPNADNFDPENFSEEKNANRHPCSFIPFSYGPRNCIGSKYAMMSMKTMLAFMLRKYRFRTDLTMDTIVKKFEITLKLNNLHLVTVERRAL